MDVKQTFYLSICDVTQGGVKEKRILIPFNQ